MDSIDVISNLNNEFSHMNSNSPQQERENSPWYVGCNEQIKTFCNQEHQKQCAMKEIINYNSEANESSYVQWKEEINLGVFTKYASEFG